MILQKLANFHRISSPVHPLVQLPISAIDFSTVFQSVECRDNQWQAIIDNKDVNESHLSNGNYHHIISNEQQLYSQFTVRFDMSLF